VRKANFILNLFTNVLLTQQSLKANGKKEVNENACDMDTVISKRYPIQRNLIKAMQI
jgi:hypothetical protein